jgi:hypothetical protein
VNGVGTAKEVPARFIAHITMKSHPRERLVLGTGVLSRFRRIARAKLPINNMARKRRPSKFQYIEQIQNLIL